MTQLHELAQSIQGKVALVTGGTGGIGRAVCHAFAAAGARVVVVDRHADAVTAGTAGLTQAYPSCEFLGLVLDVTREDDMQRMVDETVARFSRIDILATCAGILRAPGTLPKPLANHSLAEWQIVIDVNLTGMFLSNRAVLPAMIRQRGGVILNLASTSGQHGKAHDAAYCASKFGVIGLSESLAEEVRPYGIKVQIICPDAVDTPLWDQNGPIKPEIALAPERVADLFVFLAALPADTIIPMPVIAPFRTRRRVAKERPAGETQGAGA